MPQGLGEVLRYCSPQLHRILDLGEAQDEHRRGLGGTSELNAALGRGDRRARVPAKIARDLDVVVLRLALYTIN